MSLFSSLTTADLPNTSELILLGISCIVPFLAFCYGILLHLTPPHPDPEPTSLLYSSPTDTLPSPLPPPLSHPPMLAATKALTIVVPAYNEALRLPLMLEELHAWLTAPERTSKAAYGRVGEGSGVKGWEVMVVDDGSSDGTSEVALGVGRKWEEKGWKGTGEGVGRGEMRVVRLGRNVGKGGAVRHGVLHSRGARVLFADADGASTFSSLEKLQRDLDEAEVRVPTGIDDTPTRLASSDSDAADGQSNARVKKRSGGVKKESTGTLGMAIGSRAHLVDTDLVVKRSFLRNLLMHGFHLFVKTLGVRDVRDTQCGFKLFTRPTAALLFPPMNLSRWSFDVELLVLADLTTLSTTPPSAVTAAVASSAPLALAPLKPFKIPVIETAIEWHEVDGSKISLAWDSLGMARDLVVLRACLMIGRWEAPVLLVSPSSSPSSETK